MTQKLSFQMIAEMKEFATFTAAEQRYIRRSLDVAATGAAAAQRRSRNPTEEASIQAQTRLYRTLLEVCSSAVPDDNGVDAAAEIIGPLITLSTFDLGEGKLTSFAAYRFLYERLLGGPARAWLPGAFVAAAALPCLHPELRKVLLRSITEANTGAVGWSSREPVFTPEWVEKVPITVC